MLFIIVNAEENGTCPEVEIASSVNDENPLIVWKGSDVIQANVFGQLLTNKLAEAGVLASFCGF